MLRVVRRLQLCWLARRLWRRPRRRRFTLRGMMRFRKRFQNATTRQNFEQPRFSFTKRKFYETFPREDPRNILADTPTCSRGCYEENVPVEFQLYRATLYASARYVLRSRVCLSDILQVGVLLKRLNVGPRGHRRTIAKRLFFCCQRSRAK